MAKLSKQAVRQQVIQWLQAYQQQPAKQQAQQQLYQQLFALPQWQQARSVALTFSQPLEIDVQPVIQAAWQAGKQVYVPKVMPKRQMAFLPYTTATPLTKSKFGLWEPRYQPALVQTQFDLMLVPGLAFSAARQRLGFGGGYYDRFLSCYPQQTVSLALSGQYVETATWPVAPFDVIIDQVLTVDGCDVDAT